MTSNLLPNSFFSGWVITLTIIGLLYLCFLLISTYLHKSKTHQNIVWDENLSEGDRPLPQWFFGLFAISIIFSSVYLMLFPGLGGFKGLLDWTSGGHHTTQQAQLKEEVKLIRSNWESQSIELLQQNPEAMKSAYSLYKNNCASCHGKEAKGIENFAPNLKDDDWIWGGDAQNVYTSIKEGRVNIMPGWSAILGEQGVADMVTYVKSLNSEPTDKVSQSALLFGQLCSACHGPGGVGNQIIGAPRLNDSIWLYGDSREQLQDIIANGVINNGKRWKQATMPSQKNRLEELEIRLLTALVLSK
ncbi:MAG: c-type cytochrome [Methylacidiphilales bacterium]|nr:c-type cytochrome [Candidatus Methylacidiphilales bacterium]